MSEPWLNFAVALALGLLIGLERERRKGEGPGRSAAGVRSFALATLLGAVAIYAGGPWALVVALSGVALLTAISYFKDRSNDPGMTTEVALLFAPLIGALAVKGIVLAGVIGVTVAAVLASKASVHRFVKGTLSEQEVNDGLLFAIATVVVWPQLPDRSIGPYDALNPHAIWLFVILVLAISAGGHMMTRVLGPRYGLPLAGLASGFVSSTATIGAMGTRAAQSPADLKAATAGATLSTVATYVQLCVLLAVTSRPTLAAMVLPLLAGGVVAVLYGIAFTVLALKAPTSQSAAPGRAFSAKTALALAATLAVMMVISTWMRERYGEAGIVLGSAIGGLIDTHASAISVASLASSGTMSAGDTVLPILAAMTTNAAAKAVMAAGTSQRSFAVSVVPGLALSTAAAWLAALATMSI